MKAKYFPLLLLIILSSCFCQGQQADNTEPMYGESRKTDGQNRSDKEFRKLCIEQFGSIDSSIVVHLDLAWRQYYNNQLETAMKRFNQVWLLSPNIPDPYYGFASLLETEGNPEEAKRFYEMGEKKDSLNLRKENCYQRIADCKEQLKDIIGTIEAYEKITELNSKNSLAFKKIGFFQMNLGNSEEAIKAYSIAIELDPKDAMTFNNRAYLNQTLKKHQLAIDDYSEAIELNPKYISALVNRGITQMEIGQYKKAKLDFEKCVNLDPKAGELRRFLAISQLSLKEKSDACKNLELASMLGDDMAVLMIEERCKK